MSDKMFVNDLDLFYAFKLYKNLLLCNQGSCPVFFFTWVHYTRRMSTDIVDPQPWSEIRIYLPDSLLDWRERDVHSYDCD